MEQANLLQVKIPPQFKTVDLSNCLEVLRLSGDSELLEKAMDLTLENFKTLQKTEDFLKLPVSDVIKILKSDDLNVSSEEDVFYAVKSWVNHDDANRKSHLTQLMGFVRLSLLSAEFILEEVMEFCPSCGQQAILDKVNKSFIQTQTPRRKKEKIALVGGDDDDTANTIDIYDELKKSWTLSESIGINKRYFASVIVNEKIIIIGGKNSFNKRLTSVEYIDLKSGQKHPLKPLNEARCYFSAVTLRRDSSTDAFAIGGYGGRYSGNILTSVERWNSTTGDWEIIAPLLMAVCNHSASVIGEKIYVTGGQSTENGISTTTNKVQMYSEDTNTWSYRAQMIKERQNHSSVVFKRKLFVAGGIDSINFFLDSVEFYNPVANLWTEFSTLPRPAYGICLCSFKNKLLCMGGNVGYNNFSDVWEYNETSKTWKALENFSKSRAYFNAHVIPYDSII